MSKGLEALVSLELNACQTSDQKEWAYNIIEKELKRLEELEKAFDSLVKESETLGKMLSKEIEKNRALEIIKNKGVDILALQHYKNASQYNFSLRGMFAQLTEEEFNLLKEVLL